jgi:hypothetical protein
MKKQRAEKKLYNDVIHKLASSNQEELWDDVIKVKYKFFSVQLHEDVWGVEI